MPKQTLPDHPGDLLRLAVLDLAAARANTTEYGIDMSIWMTRDEAWGSKDGKCMVCFAGSVMAGSLRTHVKNGCSAGPRRFREPDTTGKLLALNSFREGFISSTFRDLGQPLPPGICKEMNIVPYEEDPDLFMADMLDLAALLDVAIPHE